MFSLELEGSIDVWWWLTRICLFELNTNCENILRSKEFFDIQLVSSATHILVQLRNHISTENLRGPCHGWTFHPYTHGNRGLQDKTRRISDVRPIYLYLIFEKSSLKNRRTGFLTCKNQFWNWFLQATQAVKSSLK